MSESSAFWENFSLVLGIIASLLTIVAYFKSKQVKDLRLSLKQSQEQYQQVILNLSQKVPVIEKDTRAATDVLKEKFPKKLYYWGFYGLILLVGVLILHFWPKITDPSKVTTMSFGSWLFLILLACALLGLPLLIRRKISESLKGTSFTNVKIYFEPKDTKIQSGSEQKGRA